MDHVPPAVPMPNSISTPAPSGSTPVSVSNIGTRGMPHALYPMPPSLPHRPGPLAPPSLPHTLAAPAPAPAPPGISPTIPFDVSAFPRPTLQAAPLISNNSIHQSAYAPYSFMPPVAASFQGQWLPPPQVSPMLRPPFSAYPASFTGPFALPARGIPTSFVPLPDTQPPGVTSSASPITQTSLAPSTSMSATASVPPPGNDDNRKATDKDAKNGSSTSDNMKTWTAHKTETGAIYYYNALTGESTYEQPAGFKEEVDKLTGQTTPMSWEKLAGTDWVLVTTNDAKRYYYNMKTKMSSWQIPSEVTDVKKKQEADTSELQPMSQTSNNVSAEKVATPVPLNALAINTGGRDAMGFRSSPMLGQSSALDLIKKKLQDSGMPPVLQVSQELNGSQLVEEGLAGVQNESSKDKPKDAHGDNNISDTSSDSEDDIGRPTKQECVVQFKEMLKECGVAPFSKWEKELPKLVFDPRFKAIPSHSTRRALFDHYVKTRAEEERKEKRAAQKAATEGFKQLLDEAKEDIDHNTDYQAFKKKWGNDPRFLAIERREREALLNDRIHSLKRVAEEKAQTARAAAVCTFKSMLREKADITPDSRWSRVKDSLRNDPRYISVMHEEREMVFNEYVSELKAEEEGLERVSKDKYNEEEKLKERERALRKRKEREEQEVEWVRVKARRKEAFESYQSLLVETIKNPQATWTESKPKLDKDAQGRAANPNLDQSDMEKLFREHIKTLQERCVSDFRALLAEVITVESGLLAREREDGKTALTSWSVSKRLLKADPRYLKMPRNDREPLWRRHVDDVLRRKTSLTVAQDNKDQQRKEAANKRSSMDTGISKRNFDSSRR